MMTSQQSDDTARIPAVIPVRVRFKDEENAALDELVWSGTTRDVSDSGLSVRLKSPVEQLPPLRGELKAEVDIDVGRRTIRLQGLSKWVSEVGQKACLVGVEYVDLPRETAELIAQHARRMHHRPVVIRTAVLAAVVVGLVSAGLYWRATSSQARAVAAAEQELQAAAQNTKKAALELERTKRQLDRLRSSTDTQDEVLAAKEQELARLRDQLDSQRARVGEISVSLHDLKKGTDAEAARSALYHYDRAGYFEDEENNIPAALKEYEKAVELDPSFADAYFDIGVINELYGRPERAIRAYEKFLELRPGADDAAELRVTISELRQDLNAPAPAEGPE